MTDDLDPQAAELAERLRALGSQPVDPPLASAHLTAMAAIPPVGRMRQRLAVAGALLAGTLIGSTGLAAAGALPRPVQDVAHTALAKVNVEVPVGTERYDGPECVGDAPARNRGQYLKQERAKGAEAFAAAKATKCGMPLVALAGGDDAEEEQETGEEKAGKGAKAAEAAKERAAKERAAKEKGAEADDTDTDDTDDTTATTAQGAGKPEEPGKSECVDRGQGNAGGRGQANKPEEPGEPDEPGKPAAAGPAGTGKPDETGKPACPEPGPAGQGSGQPPATSDDSGDDDGKPAGTPDRSQTNPGSPVRPG